MGVLDSGFATFKRRRFVIERGAQTRVALWVFLHLATCLALVLLLVLLPTLLRLVKGGSVAGGELAASREFVFLDGPLAAAIAVMLFVAVANSFALSNRIFGPLVRLKLILRRWRDEGAWPPALHVRRRDFHADLFDAVETAVGAVGADVAAAREGLRGAGERARNLGVRLGPGEAGAEARALAVECDQALERLERWKFR